MFSKLGYVAIVLILLVVAAVLLDRTATQSASAGGSTVSVIVELQDDPGAVYKAKAQKSGASVSDADLKAYRDQLSARQDEFLQSLASSGVAATVVSRDIKNYDGATAATIPLRYTLVLNGLALNVSRSDISTIKNMPQVKRVSPNTLLFTALNNSVKYINADKVYGAQKELTQFDEVRRDGYEGQGIYVSIIDTGIDWTHPMFGGDPNPPRLAVVPPSSAVNTNKKVVYYLPFTDIAVQDGFGHGTHVAATVAGYLGQTPGADGIPTTADDIRLHGVAPQAKLLSYKVCSDVFSTIYSLTGVALGGCASADTIMALEDSVSPFTLNNPLLPKPVANVINMSLGGSGGPDNPTAVAASNAALAGATVVAASGNSGPGEGTTGSPAAGTHVISVGATTHPGAAASVWSTEVLQQNAIPQATLGAITPAGHLPADPGFSRLRIFAMSGSTGLPPGAMAQHYVYVDNPLVAWPTTVRGRIAFVNGVLGATNFDVVMQAYNAGAVGVIVIDDRGAVNGIKTLIPAATILPEDGQILINAISSTDNDNPANGVISELPIRMNPFFSNSFMGEMAGFSSRGPVRGLGQVKPDVSAPGVAVLAACPPASLLGAIAALGSPTSPNYIAIDGTSMATPHTAGAAALITQAHPDWSPDVIRTVLINTSTNMRDQSGAPKADGLTADSIISQGGGLIDVNEAINARAIMGVAGDGVTTPGILGSHSFGEVPVINSRITHTSQINVTVRDLSGQGGAYNLAVANNRDLQLAGINVTLSQSGVSVGANGEATFTVSATVDGDLLRDVMAEKTVGSQVILEKIQMQWFVTATRSDGGESLRMPFFFRPGPSMPAEPVVVTTEHTDIMPAGDGGAQRDALGFDPALEGITYKDIPFEVDASTLRIEALTEWEQVAETGQPDLDYQLLDPDGNLVTQSGNGVGPEFVSVRVSHPGTYVHRVIGFSNVATEFTVTTTLTKGNTPPVLHDISGDFTNSQGTPVDFDGTINLSWEPTTGATGYEVERSVNGGSSSVVATLGAGQTSTTLTNQPTGDIVYRVRAFAAGQIGTYVTAPSNPASVIVDPRTKVDITSQVSTAMTNVSFVGGVFSMDLSMTNNSTNSYVPLVDLNVVGISSASGTVTVRNADNGGNGKSVTTAALFGYSNQLGADQVFSPSEATGSRTLQFNDSAAEMFTFDVAVTAFQSTGGASASASGGSGGDGPAAGGEGSSGSSTLSLTRLLRITVNPLTKTVSLKLL